MEFKNLYKVLTEYAEEVKREYISNLKQNDRVASGNLIGNITPKIVDDGNEIKVYLVMPEYWGAVEDGRPPTKNAGDGTLQTKILQWIRDKGIQPYADRNGNIPTENQLAYLITRKIHNFGYEGGEHLKKTLDIVFPHWEDRIYDALLQDVYDEFHKDLVDTLNGIGI